jgi:hypothetical protein
MWCAYPFVVHDTEQWIEADRSEKAWDPYLRSTHDVTGNHIQAEDGEIGHVEDFIIDTETWAIRYMIIDTQNWWSGQKALMSPKWIERVSWIEAKVFVNLPRETIRQAPEYTEESLLTREYETRLHAHYNRPGYWVDEATGKARKERRSTSRTSEQGKVGWILLWLLGIPLPVLLLLYLLRGCT